VLINNTLANKLNTQNDNISGKTACSLNLLLDCEQDNPSTPEQPWAQVIKDNSTNVGVRMSFTPPNCDQLIFRVNTAPILDERGTCLGTMSSFEDITELEQKNRELEKAVVELTVARKQVMNQNRELQFLAARDPMTKCYNRRALFESLQSDFEQAKLNGTALCCIMADIDHFKKINDTHGHLMGDKIIKLTAEVLKGMVRPCDVVARYGGEEFCIVLPGMNFIQAQAVAERCRKKMACQNYEQIRITASFGVTSMGLGAMEPIDLINQADKALYNAKASGRNCVSAWDRRTKSSAMRDASTNDVTPPAATHLSIAAESNQPKISTHEN